jgi:hypothetical protein
VRAFAAAVVIAGLIVAAGAAPAAADDGLRFEASTTYEVQPEDERVRVTMDVTLTNLLPDQGNQYFYFDQIGIPVLAEATNVAARRVGGGTLSTGLQGTDDPLWSTLTVRLSPVLRYGSPQQVQVSYDLPNLAPRSAGWTRVTEAYAAFLVFAVGDPGRTDVTVIVPSDYTDLHAGGAAAPRRNYSNGQWIYRDSEIGDPENWWLIFAARNDDLLAERAVAVADHAVTLRYWPGDDEWADFAEEVVTTGIPALESLLGLPWPVAGELNIIESSAPHAYGYGGWYDPSSDLIEVSDELDRAIMLHELAHAWFNPRLSVEAWFLEGLAELYAHRALAELEGSAPEPELPPDSHPGAQPLTTWEQVPFESDDADDYVYATAWWLLDQVYEEIGTEAMATVIAAAAEREIAYRSNLDAETVPSQIDWRRLLDLFVEVGGSESGPELFGEYVLDPDDLAQLDEWQAARAGYAEFVAGAGGWSAPLELREAMTRWRFDEIDKLIAAAGEVLGHRDEVLAVVAGLGVDELPMLAEDYQRAAVLADVGAAAAEYREIALVIGQAQDTGSGAAGLLAEIGLLGADVADRLVVAADTLAAGDVASARSTAEAVRADVDQAPVIGAVLLGQVIVAAGLFWPLRRRHQRRVRERQGAVGSDPWPSDEPYSSLSSH